MAESIPLLLNDPNPQSLGLLGFAYARSGRRDAAEQLLAAPSAPPNQQALIFAGLGDDQRALDALDRMTVLGPQRVGMYLNSPQFASFRGDPRVTVIRRRIGLPD
jgi:hypothetical protein